MSVSIRIVALGEIVGRAGIFCVKTVLKKLKRDRNIDFVIANGEGATGGFGLGARHSEYLRKLGIDVLTTGEKAYFKKDMVGHIRKASYILRPANLPARAPGRGWALYECKGRTIGVLSLLGLAGYDRVHPANPFGMLQGLVARIREHTPIILLDFHAATTAEKAIMAHMSDGLVSALIGSHAKVPTADERILPEGTAAVTDTGRTGSAHSVGGLAPEIEIRKFLTGIPERSKDAWDDVRMRGVIIDIGDDGKAVAIERIDLPCEGAVPHD